jgi:hypothetical protein
MHIHFNLTKPTNFKPPNFSVKSNFLKENRKTMRFVLVMDKLMCTKIPPHTPLYQPKRTTPTLFHSQLERVTRKTLSMKPHWSSQTLNGYTKARTKPCFLENEISFKFT